MKIRNLIEALQKLDLDKEIMITVPDTEFFSDFSVAREYDEMEESEYDPKTGWFKNTSEGKTKHYAIYFNL